MAPTAHTQESTRPDIVLVGAGIMSATLGVLLKELNPGLTIEIFESLDMVAGESSDAWNNAGTGHAALCELNYTPRRSDGTVDISKALAINEEFHFSRQLWSHLVERGVLGSPAAFIHSVPHMSFVRGSNHVAYLRKRHEALRAHHCFAEMEFSEDREELAGWIPLLMEGRAPGEPVAATRMAGGTDVNFGALTRVLIAHLERQEGVVLHLRHKVTDLRREADSRWRVVVQNRGFKRSACARFVFLGAGGGALHLLQKSGIPEERGFAGFPVSGQWLRCEKPDLVERHQAKVYGKASLGTPPMSVPHLDTRIIDGKKWLLFGPFAGFSTRFLKHGSLFDLPESVRLDNLFPMLAVGRDNVDLTKYLVGQVFQSPAHRLAALREYYPNANGRDWKLKVAGQRVQIIKKDTKRGGVLQFGTEVVSAKDGSLAALLGASPGASTSVFIMLDVLRRCFAREMDTADWRTKLRTLIPSIGESLAGDAKLFDRTRAWTNEVLGLAPST